MRIDFFTDTDGFKYCYRCIPYMKIEAKKGVLINLRTKKVIGKQVILYKHYIKDNLLLTEPVLDEDVYDIRGGDSNDCVRTFYPNDAFQYDDL